MAGQNNRHHDRSNRTVDGPCEPPSRTDLRVRGALGTMKKLRSTVAHPQLPDALARAGPGTTVAVAGEAKHLLVLLLALRAML